MVLFVENLEAVQSDGNSLFYLKKKLLKYVLGAGENVPALVANMKYNRL